MTRINIGESGAPGESRTPDLLVRSQTLYPAELRARSVILSQNTRLPRVARFAEADSSAHLLHTAKKQDRKSHEHADGKDGLHSVRCCG